MTLSGYSHPFCNSSERSHPYILGIPPSPLPLAKIFTVEVGKQEVSLGWGQPLGLGLSGVGCSDTHPLILLQLVMRYWEPVPRGPVLWEAQAEPWATWVPLLCFVLHVISWLLIFSILLVFDYAELMGLKQVRLPDPSLRPLILSRTPLSLPRMSLLLLPLAFDSLASLSCKIVSPQRPETMALLDLGKIQGPKRRVRDPSLRGVVLGLNLSYRRRVPGRGGKRQPSCDKGLSPLLSRSPSPRCTTTCWGWVSPWP